MEVTSPTGRQLRGLRRRPIATTCSAFVGSVASSVLLVGFSNYATRKLKVREIQQFVKDLNLKLLQYIKIKSMYHNRSRKSHNAQSTSYQKE